MCAFFRLGSIAALVAACGSTAVASPLVRPAAIVAYPRFAPVSRMLRHVTPPRAPSPRFPVTIRARFAALAGGWEQVAAMPPFLSTGAGHAMLMTNGEVLIQSPNSPLWFGLVPDASGSYVNGSWKQQASLPAGYSPLYYASAVLPDGRLIISGGEYNGGSAPVWGNGGAIYDITRNRWTPVAPPAGWRTIGDALSTVAANGTYMLGDCCSTRAAYLNPATLSWTATGSGKADDNNEEGWTLLPNGQVLTVDIGLAPASELFNPVNGFWSTGGALPLNLSAGGEIGPQILRQNGHVFAVGANQYTAIYNPSVHSWSAGPRLPIINGQQVEASDGPAALLPNGDVLMPVSPGETSPSYFLDFPATGGNAFTRVAGPPNAPNDASYVYNLLVLPTGQVLETDFSNDVEIYTPPTSANTSIAPMIASVPTALTHGSTYTAYGTLFSGVSQGNGYGDDAQAATNYPLVEIINNASGNVQFARTHHFSSMAVASSATVSTQFDVPPWAQVGASKLIVVANGIKSQPVAVTVK